MLATRALPSSQSIKTVTVQFTPRLSQRKILEYKRGKLGISAVPGSGKTHTLSALTARIIEGGQLEAEQEVLIVTLVNSAVDNFSARVGQFIKARGLIPQLGYRVRTLHGLAHDIVREDPPLVGLDKKFTIVDDTASSSLVHDAASSWVRAHPDFRDAFLSPGLDDYQHRKVHNRDWPDLVESVAVSFIRSAKDRLLSPERLRLELERQPSGLPLARMGLEIYSDYQRALTYRGAVDFDDLIRLACAMLEASTELLERLRYRWPFILEDEAQDSSEIQQKIISSLAGDDGNWVRVGDPNQAIFETFTTANPRLLLDFIRNNRHVDMPESGRCQPSIMNLANHLIDWVMSQHPHAETRDALNLPYIKPAPRDDPQPNPQNDPGGVKFISGKYTPEEEVKQVVSSIEAWLPQHKDLTVAVLTSTNDHAAHVVEALKRRNIEYRELLRSTSPTRAAAGALSHVLSYLAAPESSSKLAMAYRVWRREWRQHDWREALISDVSGVLRKSKNVEDFLYPNAPLPRRGYEAVRRRTEAGTGNTALVAGVVADLAEVSAELAAFRIVIGRWHGATILPIDQLVLTLAPEIFASPADLALAHKLALVLRQVADENPTWRLPELAASLHEIARNERRFIGFSTDDSGFNPDNYKGVVVVSTMHKAKGLEWDRVYLMAMNNYDYPSNEPGDRFISEKWFLRDGLNLEAEALGQLHNAHAAGEFDYAEEGAATYRARLDYVRERLRLVYVGITRARRELILTWNSGRGGDATPSLPFAALRGWWEAEYGEPGNPRD
jgi:DNA helicase-2/ATP-dependent DNA helicase PcrA